MKKLLILIIFIIFFLTLDAFYIEPNKLKINSYDINSSKITSEFDGLKIVHFSDTLYTNKLVENNIENLVNEINNQNADIIVFTGDLINKKINDTNKKLIINYLKNIDCKLYKYAILGDRDSNTSKEILEQSGFILLDNNYQLLFNNSNDPIIISNGDINITDNNINPIYSINLIHKPDDVDNLNNTNDLILAGHCLGGQIRLPFYGAIYNFKGASKYTSNYHEFNDSIMYISYGIGTKKYNARLFNKPSINIYRLYAK